MALKEMVKYTIGKETIPGVPVGRTAVLPIRDIGSLDRTITKKEDPLIVGLGMASGEYAVAGDVKGSIPLSPRGCTGFGHVLKGVFGTEDTPVEIVGAIRVKYRGNAESCKLIASLSSKTIASKVGDLGSELDDVSFGSNGVIDLTAVDTLQELVDAINAGNYEAALVTGIGTTSVVSVVSGIFQARGKYAFLFFTGTGSGVFLHRYTPDLSLDSERPTYSIQKDGIGDNYLYDGVVFNNLSLSGEQKGDIEADVDVLGMKETSGVSASVLVMPHMRPYKFGGGFTSLAGTRYSQVRKHSLKVENNHIEDGYGQADESLDRTYHQRGKFAISGDLTVRLDGTSIKERPKAETGEHVAVQFLYYEVERRFNFGVRGLMLIEIPYAELSETPSIEANGDVLDMEIKFKGFKPAYATDYEPPVVVSILTADANAY